MRRKLALLTAATVAGATISMGAAAPAQAQDCTATDPTLAYVCTIINNAPDPVYLVDYYYDKAGEVVYKVYCTAWPPC